MTPKKITALMRLYSLLERSTAPWHIACKKGCATCCTTHVTMTTLEGQAILDFLEKAGRALPPELGQGELFTPVITTNGLAMCCMRHEEPPEEEKPDHFNPCLFLENNACTIYPVRPLGCRVMLSQFRCQAEGWAEMEDYWITINQVFLQALEAMDSAGKFGNMSLILKSLDSGKAHNTFLKNQPVPGLMVPPEHQQDIQAVLGELNKILAQGMS